VIDSRSVLTSALETKRASALQTSSLFDSLHINLHGRAGTYEIAIAISVVDTVHRRPVFVDPESASREAGGFTRVGPVPFADRGFQEGFYGWVEPLVAGDSVVGCGAFGATCLLSLRLKASKPKSRSRTKRPPATRPNVKIDLSPPLENSSSLSGLRVTGLSAMTISPVSFVHNLRQGGVSQKLRARRLKSKPGTLDPIAGWLGRPSTNLKFRSKHAQTVPHPPSPQP
jgi:hypothetical protein